MTTSRDFGATVAAFAREHDLKGSPYELWNDVRFGQSDRLFAGPMNDPFSSAEAFKGGGGGKGGGGTGNGRNFDPEAQDQSGTVSEDDLLTFDLLSGATDKNGDTLSIIEIDGTAIPYNAWTSLASGARVFLEADGLLTYDPSGAFDALDEGASSIESFSFTVSDGRGGMSVRSVTIEVVGVADESKIVTDAVDDTFEVGAAQPTVLEVLKNDIDGIGGGLRILQINGATAEPGVHISLASGAEVVVNADGTLSYDASETAAFVDGISEDHFSYTVEDVDGGADTAFAELRIAETPSDPTSDVSYYIDALLAGETARFNADQALGTGDVVTFAFPTATPSYYASSSTVAGSFQAFSEQQQDAVRDILSEIEAMTGLTFVETLPDEAEMVFGIANFSGDTRGMAFYPSANAMQYDGDVWIDGDTAGTVFEPGTIGHLTLLHEIGHALGLKHPDPNLLSWIETTRQYTDMAYGEHTGSDLEPSSYMLYDIAALQHLYGSNDMATSADDYYSIDEDVRTIWDAGGKDTLDFSSSTTGAIINLTGGSFSSSAGQGSNLAIAFGTEIENAVGTDYDDEFFGNELDNVFSGGSGADRFALSGDSGQDLITDFNAGEDQIVLSGLTLDDLILQSTENGWVLSHHGGSLELQGVSEELDLDTIFV